MAQVTAKVSFKELRDIPALGMRIQKEALVAVDGDIWSCSRII